MPVKKLSESQMKKLKEHSKDHGGSKHYNAMKRLMEEPPYPSMNKAHSMLMKKDKKKPLSKAEKAQTTQDRLNESEGKKKGMEKTKGQKKNKLVKKKDTMKKKY